MLKPCGSDNSLLSDFSTFGIKEKYRRWAKHITLCQPRHLLWGTLCDIKLNRIPVSKLLLYRLIAKHFFLNDLTRDTPVGIKVNQYWFTLLLREY